MLPQLAKRVQRKSRRRNGVIPWSRLRGLLRDTAVTLGRSDVITRFDPNTLGPHFEALIRREARRIVHAHPSGFRTLKA